MPTPTADPAATAPGLRLRLLDGEYVVCRSAPGAAVPEPDTASPPSTDLWSLTLTGEETSLVCRRDVQPRSKDWRIEAGWRALRVVGTLAFEEVGILRSLSSTLAGAGIPIFVVSTFDTDYLLVPTDRLEFAVEALVGDGHALERGG